MVVSSLFTGSVFAADALVSDQTQVPNGNAFILNKIESATASFTHDTTSNFYGTLLNDGETNPVNENYSLDLTVNGTLVGDGMATVAYELFKTMPTTLCLTVVPR